MRSGLSFSFNYTWSHMLSNQDSSGRGTMMGTQNYQRAYDTERNYGNSNFDVRHAFKGHTIYELPFGRGRAHVNQNAVADKIIGGWRASGTLVWQVGSPFTPIMAKQQPAYRRTTLASEHCGGSALADPTINSWSNVNAFAAPTPGTFGNMGRNISPGRVSSTCMSLAKRSIRA
jgi:hypothetical protein